MSVRTPRVVASLIGAGALIAGPLSVPASAAVIEIQILGINDFHGRLEAEGTTATSNPGAAKLAGVVDRLRALNPTGTVFVAAGDNVGATTFTSQALDDRPTIDALNAMDLDASAVGNHEFDRGYDWLSDPVTHGVDGQGRAEWVTLGANVAGENPPMAPSTVIATGNGVNVGLVGIVTEQTGSLVSPDGIEGITFDGALAAANTEASRLKSEGLADVVILMSHEGSESTVCDTIAAEDTAFGEIVRGLNDDVDALIAGHTHTPHDCVIDGRPVLQTGQYGVGLDQLTMTVDTDTNEVVSVNDASTGVVNVPTDVAAPDAEVAAIVAAAVAEADPIGQVELGRIGEDITRAFSLQPNPDPAPPSLKEDRGLESVLGNLVADVQLEATQLSAEETGAEAPQIAFMNPGGLRADLLYATSTRGEGDGVVTYREAATVQPFANSLFTMTLTGEQIGQILEQQWQPAGASRPFLHLGVSEGFTYTYDPLAAAGSRITSMTLNDVEIEASLTYRVAMNSFLAAGGDNFTTFRSGTGKADTGQTDLDAMVDYFDARETVDPSRQERAVQEGQYKDELVTGLTVTAPPLITRGEPAEVTVDVTTSAAIAGQFVVSLSAPDGLQLSSDAAGCTAAEESLVDCALTDLPAGTTTLTFVVEAAEDAPTGPVELDAVLYSPQFDANPLAEPHTASAGTTVILPEVGGKLTDLNADGLADLLAVRNGQLVMFPGTGGGALGPRRVLVWMGVNAPVYAPGDLDTDGFDDVLITSGATLRLRSGDGEGGLGAPRTVLTGVNGYTFVAPGDWNGDGNADLLGRNRQGQLRLFPGTGDGGFGASTFISNSWGGRTMVGTGDFNGDGDVDLVTRDGSNRLVLRPGDGVGGFEPSSTIPGSWARYAQIGSVGDLSGDGLADLLAVTRSGVLYRFDGTGTGGVEPRVRVSGGWSGYTLVN